MSAHVEAVCPPEHTHGVTRTCYAKHRCRCEECTEANRRYQRSVRAADRTAREQNASAKPAVTSRNALVTVTLSASDAAMVATAVNDRAMHLARVAQTAGITAPLIRERVRGMRDLVQQLRQEQS